MGASGLSFFIAGGFSGIASSWIVAPVEHLRIRLQIQGTMKEKLYSGSIDAGVKIFKQHGLKAVCKGFLGTLLRDIGMYSVYFCTYEHLTRYMKSNPDDPVTPVQSLISGGFSGISCWLVVFPLDCLKSIEQTDSLLKDKRLYKGYLDLVSKVVKRDGFANLYKGLDVCLMRAFPVNAVTFLFYEIARNEINQLNRKGK